jgi:hypothetical protein
MKERLEPASFSFEHWDSIELDPLTLLNGLTRREVWWNWDSAYTFLTRAGWRIIESDLRPIESIKGAAFSVEIKAMPFETGDETKELQIPWGRKPIVVKRLIYERWLTWGAFRNQGELEGLGWQLVEEGEKETGRFFLEMAFKIQPRWRTLKKIILARLRIGE